MRNQIEVIFQSEGKIKRSIFQWAQEENHKYNSKIIHSILSVVVKQDQRFGGRGPTVPHLCGKKFTVEITICILQLLPGKKQNCCHTHNSASDHNNIIFLLSFLVFMFSAAYFKEEKGKLQRACSQEFGPKITGL